MLKTKLSHLVTGEAGPASAGSFKGSWPTEKDPADGRMQSLNWDTALMCHLLQTRQTEEREAHRQSCPLLHILWTDAANEFFLVFLRRYAVRSSFTLKILQSKTDTCKVCEKSQRFSERRNHCCHVTIQLLLF